MISRVSGMVTLSLGVGGGTVVGPPPRTQYLIEYLGCTAPRAHNGYNWYNGYNGYTVPWVYRQGYKSKRNEVRGPGI